jgi:anti-sigma B factor antagonist
MQYTQQRIGAQLEIALSGSLDTKLPPEFEAELLRLIEHGERLLVFDFAQVDYVGSNGLRVMLRVFKQMTAAGGRIVLHSLSQPVKKVFEIAGLAMFFRICDSRDDALDVSRVTGLLPKLENGHL